MFLHFCSNVKFLDPPVTFLDAVSLFLNCPLLITSGVFLNNFFLIITSNLEPWSDFLQLSMIWPYSGLFGLYDFENGKRWRHMNFYFQLILKSPKNYENLGFSTSGLCLAFKKFFGLFSTFLAIRCLEYSKSFKFE